MILTHFLIPENFHEIQMLWSALTENRECRFTVVFSEVVKPFY